MHSFIKILGLVCAFGLVLFLGIEDLLDIEELDKAIKLPIVAVLMLVTASSVAWTLFWHSV